MSQGKVSEKSGNLDMDIVGLCYSPKVLVIPRNSWLSLNMTEKLFTGTLNKNINKTKQKIWTLKICIHDISKTITARSFKLCQLIEDDE